jgi:hypothetical protein
LQELRAAIRDPESQELLAPAAARPCAAAASSSKSFQTISTSECRSQFLRFRIARVGGQF